MAAETPLVVEYAIESSNCLSPGGLGVLKFYLAPKMDVDEHLQ